MHCNATMEQVLVLCDCLLVYKNPVCQADHSDVFHATNPELGHVDLVILGIGERCREEVLVILDSLCDDSELLFSIKVFEFAGSAEDSHGHDWLTARLFVNIFYSAIFSRAESINV